MPLNNIDGPNSRLKSNINTLNIILLIFENSIDCSTNNTSKTFSKKKFAPHQ